jgi:hypothetical protein
MRLVAGLAALALCGAAAADDQMRQVQRALIQRDQQSAEFAAQVRGQDVGRLQQLHAAQLRDVMTPPLHVMPYQREQMARERELVFPPPIVQVKPPPAPLPLPGGPRHGVDPIPVQGTLH